MTLFRIVLLAPVLTLSAIGETRQPFGVCPPFPLRDEAGKAINPVAGPKVNVPYSPRRTCGAAGCHDYGKITQGFHFTQGKGEAMPKEYAARYQWASSPGNYGGNWCSPAPLYLRVPRDAAQYGQCGLLNRPPSTQMVWPVTKSPASPASATTTFPTSDGSPTRPSGVRLAHVLA